MGRPTGSTWDRFWRGDRDLSDIYGTDGRVVRALDSVGPWKERLVLEAGCGSGRDGVEMAARGAKVVLLDSSKAALDTARQAAVRGRARVWLVRADVRTLPFRADSFDAVFHQGLLEHFRDPAALLSENRRVLRSGGVVLADVPQAFHPYTVMKKLCLMFGVWFAGWETEFTPRSLARLADVAGFRLSFLYGAWLRPSLAYRTVRQGLARAVGVRLPLYPEAIPALARARSNLANKLSRTPLGLWTSCNIGAVATKVPGAESPQ